MKHYPEAKYIVVFVSKKKYTDEDYQMLNDTLEKDVMDIDGYLGLQSVGNDQKENITLSYWKSKEAISKWSQHTMHLEAKKRANSEWYEHWSSYICEVIREHDNSASQMNSSQ